MIIIIILHVRYSIKAFASKPNPNISKCFLDIIDLHLNPYTLISYLAGFVNVSVKFPRFSNLFKQIFPLPSTHSSVIRGFQHLSWYLFRIEIRTSLLNIPDFRSSSFETTDSGEVGTSSDSGRRGILYSISEIIQLKWKSRRRHSDRRFVFEKAITNYWQTLSSMKFDFH